MTVRGRNILLLRNAIVSEYFTLYQINKIFLNILFFHYWQNDFVSRIKLVGRSLVTLD